VLPRTDNPLPAHFIYPDLFLAKPWPSVRTTEIPSSNGEIGMDKFDGLGTAVTRQSATEEEYRKRLDMLTRRAETLLGREGTLLEAIRCLGAQDDEYAPASIRK
jgi:hypothetical protein